jgi:hypothetical protein
MIVYLDKYLNTISNCQIYFKVNGHATAENIPTY